MNFQLEPDTTAKLPKVGDRWIHRDQSCAVISISSVAVTVVVTKPPDHFIKDIPIEDWETLRKRTEAAGAVFKPAPCNLSPEPCPLNPA